MEQVDTTNFIDSIYDEMEELGYPISLDYDKN